jgi:hypothetical protein
MIDRNEGASLGSLKQPFIHLGRLSCQKIVHGPWDADEVRMPGVCGKFHPRHQQ